MLSVDFKKCYCAMFVLLIYGHVVCQILEIAMLHIYNSL